MLIDILILAINKPINKLIVVAYARSNMAIAMIFCLRDLDCRRWPKTLQHELQIAIIDCKVVKNKVYYKDKLFLLLNNKLRT